MPEHHGPPYLRSPCAGQLAFTLNAYCVQGQLNQLEEVGSGTVQRNHTCQMNWTFGVKCALAQYGSPSVSSPLGLCIGLP